MGKTTISVIGSGALGKTYGGILACKNHDVHFLLKSEYESIHAANFFELNFLKTNKQLVIHPNIYSDPHKLPQSDLVIIALKTTQNGQISKLLQSCLNKSTIIMVIQNGIGNEEYFSSIFPENPIICGISTFGVTRKSPLCTQIHNLGELRLAPFKSEHTQYCDIVYQHFQHAFQSNFSNHAIKQFKNHRDIRWHKLLWNAVFGPLAIIYDEPGDVLVSFYKEKIAALMFEIKQIAIKEGIHIEDDYIYRLINETKKTSNYYPSIYIDYEKGREIEKEYLLDNVLKTAKKYAVNVPMLHGLEKQLSTLIELKKTDLKNLKR